jgi:quinone-modifying oxidoreductase subunit QmoB
METKIGTFICKGCDIAKSLDVEKLIETAGKDEKVPVCQAHDILCSPEGLESIRSTITKDELNRVVVAACSERVFPEAFDFGKDVLVDRVNLRERVSVILWTALISGGLAGLAGVGELCAIQYRLIMDISPG